jgi:predicted nucleic acid-binding protein
MAATPVLADSSYYIRLMRERRDPIRELAIAAESRDLAICGVVRCEVGRALVHEGMRKKFSSIWDVMINVPTDRRLWGEVERTAWQLDRSGRRLPLTDIVIACCAMRISAVVLTFDHHFYDIPGLRVTEKLGC